MNLAQQATAQLVEKRGWRTGTTLENRVALELSRLNFKPFEVRQQYRIGRYTVDFAWPRVRVVLEADGWHHRSPEGAAKDAERDAWLRSENWLVLRVDDRSDETSLLQQVFRAVVAVRSLDAWLTCPWLEREEAEA